MEQPSPPGQWQTPVATPSMSSNVGSAYLQNSCCNERFITKNSVIMLFIVIVLALIIYYGFVHFQNEINRIQYAISYQRFGGLAAYHPQREAVPPPPAGELSTQQLDHRAKFHAFPQMTVSKKMPITDLPINNKKLVLVAGAPMTTSPTFTNTF